MQSILKEEKNLIFVFLFATLAIFSEKIIFSLNQPLSLLFTFLVMVFIILASLRVAHHAELLAEKFGEPYGTMILTKIFVKWKPLALAMGRKFYNLFFKKLLTILSYSI